MVKVTVFRILSHPSYCSSTCVGCSETLLLEEPTYLGVTSVSCDDRTINSIYQLFLVWTFMGNDLSLIFIPYVCFDS